MIDIVITLCGLLAAGLASLRWLRVAQREHYLGGSVSRFAVRWWRLDARNLALAVIAVGATVGAAFVPALAVVTAAAVALGPIGLSLKGRTSPLAWTRRLRTVAAVAALLAVAALAAGLVAGIAGLSAALVALLLPAFIDIALWLLAPIERRMAQKFVDEAVGRLDRIDPVRVAITGSYGKTTIKGFVRHLLTGSRAVVASPASFNNTAGLSRTINEHLQPDTEVFVAEMGTYGPGEIAEMCSWIRPSVSVLASIGPVHLERFGDLDTIVRSKSEIFATSRTAILNIDAHGLADEADRLATSGLRVIRCSETDEAADVLCRRGDDGELTVQLFGELLADGLALDAAPTNVACSVAVASVLGIDNASITERLPTLPVAQHRREVSVTDRGLTVIDDTYNSNPAGAAAALDTLARLDAGRKVVVTPGMVELGRRQVPENERFGELAAKVADVVLIVGRTNRAALLHGIDAAHGNHIDVDTREQAVDWVRANLEAGDAVLYENDLPDHFA